MPSDREESKSDSTSRSLLRRAQQHDADAWQRMTDLYTPMVYEWCRRMGLQRSDAADIGQDVFSAVFKAIGGFRKERPGDSFRGWLWTITRRKITDHFRKSAKELRGEGGSKAQASMEQVSDSPPSAPGGKEESKLFHRALALIKTEFQETTWRAFWRFAVDGQSAKETAEELGITSEAVRMAKARVLKRLREEFAGLDILD